MHEPRDETLAIAVSGVTKTYRVFPSLADQAAAALGIDRLIFWRKPGFSDVHALRSIDLEVPRGERVAIVGRNGAGKTTLLKLITGNFSPTEGVVHVAGRIQALMNVGLGFHPEFTGRENLRSSLLYNGLAPDEFEAAEVDIAEFVELGEFLDQPVKNYSLGMRARLMFATATAIRPDILIIDEVLGAGDAYFAGKSADRMESLVASGCTLLLVSHSMQQVLQYCDKAIWLEAGEIVMRDEALSVVKAYEEYVHELEQARREKEAGTPVPGPSESPSGPSGPLGWVDKRILRHILDGRTAEEYSGARASTSPGGVSRWRGARGLRVASVLFENSEGRETAQYRSGEVLCVTLEVEAEEDGSFPCSFVLAVFDRSGNPVCRFCSPATKLSLRAGERKAMRLLLEPLRLGNGVFFWSAAAYEKLDLANLQTSNYYDILTRSFQIEVVDEHRDDPSIFHHPHRWADPEGSGC